MNRSLIEFQSEILNIIKERGEEFKVDYSDLGSPIYRKRVEAVIRFAMKTRGVSLKREEHDWILSEIISELIGLGPVKKLLNDPEISEIMINGTTRVYIERGGKLELTNAVFKDEEQLKYFTEQIVSSAGRRVTEYEPYVDARLKDGSRVNIIRPPASSIGTVLTIRKFSRNILSMDDLINAGTLDNTIALFLRSCVQARKNILISGGAGAGKTTLLNIISSFIGTDERVITIEDTLELKLTSNHVIPLEARPPNIEGKGEISIRTLLRNSLHMRPDRIIVGEVRSQEALDMTQAMNTGHDGSMCTLHSNSPLDCLDRLEVLLLMGSPNISGEVAKRQIISAIDLIIHMVRLPSGARKIYKISELEKSKGYILRDIFIFDETSNSIKATGIVPSLYFELKNKTNYKYEGFERNS
ncbi:MAG: CpaF family protein [Candidatus Omnitrophica bacterium]|nr:CpaF family protein [Candidatus Omnitrophota bacterium]